MEVQRMGQPNSTSLAASDRSNSRRPDLESSVQMWSNSTGQCVELLCQPPWRNVRAISEQSRSACPKADDQCGRKEPKEHFQGMFSMSGRSSFDAASCIRRTQASIEVCAAEVGKLWRSTTSFLVFMSLACSLTTRIVSERPSNEA